MKTIFEIAKNELKILFYSPVAWLMLIVFAVQTGIAFADIFNSVIKSFAMGYQMGGDITYGIYADDMMGFLPRIQQYLYLYIPLLTMGIMSRESSSGSIKLLFSSPINNYQIVMGKYISLALYNMALMIPLLLYAIFGAFTIESMDLPLVLTGILGLYLLACTYSAIGLFMSGLTSYQTVAAIGTLAVLAALTYIGTVGQAIPLVRDITYWLCISGRASEFIRGLICTDGILYFIIISLMFLSFAILQLRYKRSRTTSLYKTLGYLAVIFLVISIGYLSSRPSLMAYYDSTRMKSQTLTPNSQNALSKLEGKVTITTYVNLFANDYTSVLPQYYNSDLSTYRPYMRFKPDIKINYKYYYHNSPGFESTNPKDAKLTNKEKAERLANVYKLNFSYFMSEEESEQIKGLAEEDYRFTRIIETEDGKTARLRNYLDNERVPSESEITAAMKRLTMKAPKVGFLSDHDERSIDGQGDADYHSFAKSLTFRYALISQGFDTEAISISNGKAIPDDIDILIIADPKSEYSEPEIAEINKYISAGRNVLIAAKPNRTQFLRPITDLLGIGFMDGILVQKSENFAPDLIFGNVTKEGASLSKTYKNMYSKKDKVTFPGSSGIMYQTDKGFSIKPIITTDSTITDSTLCWSEINTKNFENEVPELNPEEKEEALVSVPLVVAMERDVNKQQQRVIVMSSADCISNGEFAVNRMGVTTNNYALITESFRWFTNGEFPIDTSRESGPDNKLKYVATSDRKTIKTTFSFIIPAILTLMGTILIIRRKNH